MNSTKKPFADKPDFPPVRNKFLPLLNDFLKKIDEKTKERIEEAETELWLYLRKAVIHGFEEYGDLKDEKTIHTMSNVLLNMDDVFHEVQESRVEEGMQ